MSKIIAIAGNPNCGKTLLFNELTGANQYVGNWPGVTVEKKGGRLRDHEDIELQDLPGVYSLSPYSPEEVVTRHYLLEQKPDLIINVVDATNLERNLYLTGQFMETGIPVIIALNMMDLVEARGDTLDSEALARALGCPVIPVSALKRTGLPELVKVLVGPIPAPAPPLPYPAEVEQALAHITERLHPGTRRAAVNLLENDSEATAALNADERAFLDEQRRTVESALEDDINSIIAGSRYDAILRFIPEVLTRAAQKDSLSARLDCVLTNRYLGMLIFAAVMWLIYYISIGTVGTWGTDWANDVLFGPVVGGWLGGFIGNTPAPPEAMVQFSAVLAMVLIFPTMLRRLHDLGRSGSWMYLAIAPYLLEYMCPHLPEGAHRIIMTALLVFNAFLLLICLTVPGQRKSNKYGQSTGRPALNPMRLGGRGGRTEFVLWFLLLSALSFGAAQLGNLCLNAESQLQALIGEGIVAGVGAVLGFLPQMAVLFLLLSFLEDCGYMARVAFMMDRIFRAIGLSGKSFIPLMVAMGCGVPGIMATRTIENERDRRLSIMLTTMIPCGAKLPVIALFSALLGQDANVATIAYFAGIGSVILGAVILRKTRLFAGGYTPFVMELPAYHLPSGTSINRRAMDRCQAFVKKAGTIIFAASALVWFLSHYTWTMDYLEDAEAEESVNSSMLHDVGQVLAPAFTPLGWGALCPEQAWKPAVATISGLIAKENIVSTLAVLYPEPQAESGSEEGAAKEEEALALSSTWPKCNAFTAPVMAAWQFNPAVRAYKAPAEEEGEEEEEDEDAEARGVAAGIRAAGAFTTVSALGFMLFNLLCIPCFAACGAIRREMNSARWTGIALLFMCTWAYLIAFLVYQLGHALYAGVWGVGAYVAAAFALVMLWLIVRPNPYKNVR